MWRIPSTKSRSILRRENVDELVCRYLGLDAPGQNR